MQTRFDICGVTSQFLHLCSTFSRVFRYQTYKQAVALAVRSNAGSVDITVPFYHSLPTVVAEHTAVHSALSALRYVTPLMLP